MQKQAKRRWSTPVFEKQPLKDAMSSSSGIGFDGGIYS